MKDLISVIIPTYNEEKYIEHTLKALKNQDFNKKFEIIVADSHSKDRTVSIARRYTDKVIIIDKKTPGAGRNAGAKVAKGSILVFLDADTVPMYNFIDIVEKTFSNKNVIAAACPILPSSYNNVTLVGAWLLNEMLLKNSIKLHLPTFATICFACRKKTFEHVGMFNEDLRALEDLEFSSRLRKIKGKYKFMSETFVITSTRRYKKWGALKAVNAWPFGYIKYKILKKLPDYPAIR